MHTTIIPQVKREIIEIIDKRLEERHIPPLHIYGNSLLRYDPTFHNYVLTGIITHKYSSVSFSPIGFITPPVDGL